MWHINPANGIYKPQFLFTAYHRIAQDDATLPDICIFSWLHHLKEAEQETLVYRPTELLGDIVENSLAFRF